MQNNTLITGYTNPDLDATACAIAYGEFLQKSGQEVVVALFGTPHREAQFALDYFQVASPLNAEGLVNEQTHVILVDASDLRGISEILVPNQVIEIIDHRKVHEADKFPNAKTQIELVGSAATLIAEKFFANNVTISSSSAGLLYSAIISNTVNFQADVTADRDRKMADWLRKNVVIPEGYIKQMFTAKSQFKKSLKEVIEDDFASFEFNGHTLGVAQLEIVNVQELITTRLPEITAALADIQSERGLEYIFLTAIDLHEATNTFVVIDNKTQKLLEECLDVAFVDRVAGKQGIMMRKTIVPLIKEKLI